MRTSKRNITYTIEDFERYHTGKMSAAERHALEKAALDDPFLADALEGYRHTSTPSNDLTVLQNRLEARTQSDRRPSATLLSLKWVRIAAIFVVVSVACGIAYFLATPKKQLALKPAAPVQKKISASPSDTIQRTISGVTISSAGGDTTEHSEPHTYAFRKARPSSRIFNKEASARSIDTVGYRGVTVSSYPAGNGLAAKQEGNAPFRNDTASLTNSIVESRAPAAPSSSRVPAFRSFSKSTDSQAHVTVMMKRLPDTGANKPIVLEHNTHPHNRYSPVAILDTLEPAKGYKDLDEYVAKNLKSAEDLKIKPIAGTVELSFEVDSQGNPVHIRVTKSLCEKCDEEAIRVLKQGPKWKTGKKKSGKIGIHF